MRYPSTFQSGYRLRSNTPREKMMAVLMSVNMARRQTQQTKWKKNLWFRAPTQPPTQGCPEPEPKPGRENRNQEKRREESVREHGFKLPARALTQ